MPAAEFLAQKHKISREEQDEIALRSHNNVERVTNSGVLREGANCEVVPVEVKDKKTTKLVDRDEHFRPGLTSRPPLPLLRLNPIPGAAGNLWIYLCAVLRLRFLCFICIYKKSHLH